MISKRADEADIIAGTGSTFIRVEGGAQSRGSSYHSGTSAGINCYVSIVGTLLGRKCSLDSQRLPRGLEKNGCD